MWYVALTAIWTGTLALALAAGRWSREQRIELHLEDLDSVREAVSALEAGRSIELVR